MPVTPTYYVAINEPRASNSNDGLSPTYRGGTRGPYKDFLSAHTFRLLWDKPGVIVEVGGGVYDMSPAGQGLEVRGAGTDPSLLTILRSYAGQMAEFVSRGQTETLRVGGQFNLLERIVARDSQGYNLSIGGGHDHAIHDCTFGASGSDSLKGHSDASAVMIRRCKFSAWGSQAIDFTLVRNSRIEDNTFHNSQGEAIGMKMGSSGNVITRNTITQCGGIHLGGRSSAHGAAWEVMNVEVAENIFTGILGPGVKLSSSDQCRILRNMVNGASAGIYLQQVEEPSGCPGGCRPNRGVVAQGNRVEGLVAEQLFWALSDTELEELQAGGNTYVGPGRFWKNGQFLEFPAWVQVIPSDATSVRG